MHGATTNKTQIEPSLAMAISMHAKPGVYALLLGSGISRPAGIPTGWDVVLDLIGKLSNPPGSIPVKDRSKWYEEEYGKEPEYSALLHAIAKQPAERTDLLNKYFEPVPDFANPEQGKPTKAHKAIAKLVSKGFIRVIVSTNFDRLMESALRAEGVEPVVISRSSEILTVPPLQHNRCTLIKVHGDYKHTDLKNSPDELSVYEPEWEPFLERIFTEYGLIICGWSGLCDDALRSILMRKDPLRSSRLYSTYWCSMGEIKSEGGEVITVRRAQEVRISNADFLFEQLEETISALEDLSANGQSITANVVRQRVKNYLFDATAGAKFHDFVLTEMTKILKNLPPWETMRKANPEQRKTIDDTMENAWTLMSTASYWSTFGKLRSTECGDVWTKVGKMFWANSDYSESLYPLASLLYCAGIGAVSVRNFDIVNQIKSVLNLEHLGAALVWLQNGERGLRNSFLSKELQVTLRPFYSDTIPDSFDFVAAFNEFDYLLSLAICAHFNEVEDGISGRHVPLGQGYIWSKVAPQVQQNFLDQRESYPALTFVGNYQQFQLAKKRYDTLAFN